MKRKNMSIEKSLLAFQLLVSLHTSALLCLLSAVCLCHGVRLPTESADKRLSHRFNQYVKKISSVHAYVASLPCLGFTVPILGHTLQYFLVKSKVKRGSP